MKSELFNVCKGLYRGDEFNAPPGYAWNILNGFSDVDYSIQQRDGLKLKTTSGPLHSTTTKIRYLYEQRWASGAIDKICRGYDGWYKVTTSFTALDVGRTADARGMACSFDNTLIMVDGGVPRKCTSAYALSALCTDAAMPQNSTAAAVHRNRVVLNKPGTMDVYLSRVSNPFAADSFSKAGDYLKLALAYVLPEYDEPLGFFTVSETFLAIVGTKFITIYDIPETTSAASLQKIIPCNPLSPYSALSSVNDWLVCLQGGFSSLSSTSAYERLKTNSMSSAIDSYWTELVESESNTQDICALINHKMSHIYITFHGETSKTLVYGIKQKNFIGEYEFHVNPYSWMEALDKTIYVGGDDGNVYELDPGTYYDGGNNIRWEYQLPYTSFKFPNLYKAPREAEILIHSNKSATVYMDVSFGLGSSQTISNPFSLSAETSAYRVSKFREAKYRGIGRELVLNPDFENRGKFIGIKIRHDEPGVRVQIPYFIMHYILEGKN